MNEHPAGSFRGFLFVREAVPAKDSAIFNTQFHSLDEAGFLCPIVMLTL